MLSLLLTALYGLALTRMVVRRLPAPPWWIPVAMLCWVNIHGGFIFGLGLLAIATCSYVIQDRSPWRRNSAGSLDADIFRGRYRPVADVRRCLMVVGATALATLANPNGLAGALYPFSYLGNNASTRYIAEWVSPDFHQTQYLYFEALFVLLLVAGLAGPRRARLVDVVIVLPFLYLAFQSVRNISLYAVLGAPITAELVLAALPQRFRRARIVTPIPRGKAILNWLAAAIIGAGILASVVGKLSDNSQAHAVATMYPVGALKYMNTHTIPSRGFDSYNWGGYLIWNWYPQRNVFVDGRPDMYGDAFMDQFVRAYDGQGSWRTLFAGNRLCFALIEPGTGIAAVLRRTPGWAMVYHDKVSQLFVLSDHRYSCR
jgi:hypothetical protein